MNPSPLIRAPAVGLALFLVAAVFVAGGCETTHHASDEQMAVAQASVQHATTSSTSENAAAELQIATAKLVSAKQAVTDKDYVRAQRLAEEAELDAQVAELHAQSARTHKAAQESQDAAHVLAEEINRKSPH